MSCALFLAASHSTIYHDSLILESSCELSYNSCKIHPAGDFCKVISRAQKINQIESRKQLKTINVFCFFLNMKSLIIIFS